MTIVTYGTEDIDEQITKQLNKLVDVVRVQELTKVDFVEREMALIKLKVSNATKESLFKYVEIFRGKILDVGKEIIIIELTGTAKKINSFLELFSDDNVVELVRSGALGIGRLSKNLKI